MAETDVELSKFLSFTLRHRPESIDLTLDSEGWADVGELILRAKLAGRDLDINSIRRVVEQNEKRRFAFSPDGLSIRAVQGHSLDSVAIEYPRAEPPVILYHGTAMRFLESIKE